MAGWTNRGKQWILRDYCRRDVAQTKFYLLLVTDAAPPGPLTNYFGELVEIEEGNGYVSGGQEIQRTMVDWDQVFENDTEGWCYIRLRDMLWQANGGILPASGDGAHYVVLTDDNINGLQWRAVVAFWDLGEDVILADEQILLLQDLELRLTE